MLPPTEHVNWNISVGPYPHLALTHWPFTVVPRPEHCTFLAGRPQLREDISKLLEALCRRDTSSIHILWSWFGAGKTHSLHYVAHESLRLSSQEHPVSLVPLYTEFPKSAKAFLDLYRTFVTTIDIRQLADAFLELSTGSYALYDRLAIASPDLATTLRILAIENDPVKRTTAIRWLRGEALPAAEFRRVGISQRINSTDQAVHIIATLLQIISSASQCKGRSVRIIWLLDEYQRLAAAGRAATLDVNAGLHALFNACPTGFSPIISFSGAPEERALPRCFSPELRDRIGATKVLVLPPLQPTEAMAFVRELLDHFRIPGTEVPMRYFPFTEDACRQVISYLASRTELRPRALMHIFNAVLEIAEPQIADGQLEAIRPDFAHAALREYVIFDHSIDA